MNNGGDLELESSAVTAASRWADPRALLGKVAYVTQISWGIS